MSARDVRWAMRALLLILLAAMVAALAAPRAFADSTEDYPIPRRIIHNGRSEIVLGTEMLLTCVRGLCGLDETGSASLLASLEETLKAANS